MTSKVAADANGRHRPILLDLLAELTDVKTGLKGTRIKEEGLYCEDESGKEVFIPADTVICAVGQKPLRNVTERLRDCAPEVMEVGDCVRPQTVTHATFRGYYAALDI